MAQQILDSANRVKKKHNNATAAAETRPVRMYSFRPFGTLDRRLVGRSFGRDAVVIRGG